MNKQWLEDYCRAQELSLKYETAKKYGSTVPGNRKRENQMILVPRGEVVDLANVCKQSVYVRHVVGVCA